MKKKEHFGMSVAEYVGAGMIAFVPASGGQQEIVNNNPAVTFDTITEAVEKITVIISNQQKAKQIRKDLPDIGELYGKEVFRKRIRDVVCSELN